jgi:hypothetical protein
VEFYTALLVGKGVSESDGDSSCDGILSLRFRRGVLTCLQYDLDEHR